MRFMFHQITLFISLFTFQVCLASDQFLASENFCKATEILVQNPNNFSQLTQALNDKDLLANTKKFVFELNKTQETINELGTNDLLQEAKMFLSFFVIHFFSEEVFPKESESSLILKEKVKELIDLHSTLCHSLKNRQSTKEKNEAIEAIPDVNAVLISFQEKRTEYDHYFMKHLDEDKKHLEDTLIKKYLEIEEKYIQTCHQIEKFDFSFVEEFSKQLTQIEKKLKFLNLSNSFETLKIARKKLYNKYSEKELEYLKTLKVFQNKVLGLKETIEQEAPSTHSFIENYIKTNKNSSNEKDIILEALKMLRDKFKTFKPLNQTTKDNIDHFFSDLKIESLSNGKNLLENFETLSFLKEKIEMWGYPNISNDIEKLDTSSSAFLSQIIITFEKALDSLTSDFRKFQLGFIDNDTIASWEDEIFEKSYNSYYLSLERTKLFIDQVFKNHEKIGISLPELYSKKASENILLHVFSHLNSKINILSFDNYPEIFLLYQEKIELIQKSLSLIVQKVKCLLLLKQISTEYHISFSEDEKNHVLRYFEASLSHEENSEEDNYKTLSFLLTTQINKKICEPKVNEETLYLKIKPLLKENNPLSLLLQKRLSSYLKNYFSTGIKKKEILKIDHEMILKEISTLSDTLFKLIQHINKVHSKRIKNLVLSKIQEKYFNDTFNLENIKAENFSHLSPDDFTKFYNLNKRIRLVAYSTHVFTILKRTVENYDLMIGERVLKLEEIWDLISNYKIKEKISTTQFTQNALEILFTSHIIPNIIKEKFSDLSKLEQEELIKKSFHYMGQYSKTNKGYLLSFSYIKDFIKIHGIKASNRMLLTGIFKIFEEDINEISTVFRSLILNFQEKNLIKKETSGGLFIPLPKMQTGRRI